MSLKQSSTRRLPEISQLPSVSPFGLSGEETLRIKALFTFLTFLFLFRPACNQNVTHASSAPEF
jgi:hypothetical protein